MDLHLHTPASADYQLTNVSTLDILRKAEERGLDIIAFTDHNSVRGYADLWREIEDLELLEHLQRLAPHEAELLPCDPLDCGRVLPEVFHLRPETRDVAAELCVLGLDTLELLLERSHARHALRLQDQHRDRNERYGEDSERQTAEPGVRGHRRGEPDSTRDGQARTAWSGWKSNRRNARLRLLGYAAS